MPVKLPLDTLLRWLGQRGIWLSPGQRLRLQEALWVLDLKDREPKDLASLLAPLVVQSAEEQKVFYDVFKEWLKLHAGKDADDSEPKEPEILKQDRKAWLIPLLGILIVGAMAFLIVGLGPEPDPLPPPNAAFQIARSCLILGEPVEATYLAEGDSLRDSSLSWQWELDGVAMLANQGQLVRPMTKAGAHRLALRVKQDTLEAVAERSFYVAAGPKPVAQIDTLPQGDSLVFLAGIQEASWRYQWDFVEDGPGSTRNTGPSDESLNGPRVTRYLGPGGNHAITLKVGLRGDSLGQCDAQSTLLLDRRELLVQLPPLNPIFVTEEALPHVWRTLTWLAWPLLCLLVFFASRFWQRYRRRLPDNPAFRKALQAAHGPPIELAFPDQSQRIGDGPSLSQLARQLRQREKSARQDLDLLASLQATIRKGGFPELQFQAQDRPVEYLALIQSRGPYDQQAQLFAALLKRLRSEEVPIQTWFFYDHPQWCFQPGREEPVSLSRLAQRFTGYRLMIFAEAGSLLNPQQSDLRKNLKPLLDLWEEKALLTPLPVADWGRAERRLREHLILLPADLAGQRSLLAAWDERDPLDFQSLQWALLDQRPLAEALQDYDLTQLADLKAYLGEKRFKWVAGAATYPRPVWAVTLAVAQAFSAELSYDDLLHLTQLPWLQDGDLPEGLRAQMLEELGPEEERIARRALLDLLAQADPPPDSHAGRERATLTAIQHLYLKPQDPRQESALQVLWEQGLLDPALRARYKASASFQAKQADQLTGIFRWLDRWLDRIEASAFQGRQRASQVVKKAAKKRREPILPEPKPTSELIQGSKKALRLLYRYRQATLVALVALVGLIGLGLTTPRSSYGGLARPQADSLSYYVNQAGEALSENKPGSAYQLINQALQIDSAYAPLLYQQALLEYRWGIQDYQRRDMRNALLRFNSAKKPTGDFPQADSLEQHATHAQGLALYYGGDTALSRAVLTSLENEFLIAFGEPNLATLLGSEVVSTDGDYVLRIKTGGMQGGNTQVNPRSGYNLFVTLIGIKDSFQYRLNQEGVTLNLSRGKTYVWSFSPPEDLGEIETIRIWADQAGRGIDDWFIESLELDFQPNETKQSAQVQAWLGDHNLAGNSLSVDLGNSPTPWYSLAGVVYRDPSLTLAER
ncbi:MAG: PLAT/LH2 domain-containing protein, partial [Bacteroidota bacterium]